MNMTRTALTLIGILMTGRTLLAHAPVHIHPPSTQHFEARAEHRQVLQQHRIVQGVQTGELTPRETVRLERRHIRIGRSIRHAEADGQVTHLEAARIHHQQKVASHRIYRKKHNARKMP